jgi:hypothetical protein
MQLNHGWHICHSIDWGAILPSWGERGSLTEFVHGFSDSGQM